MIRLMAFFVAGDGRGRDDDPVAGLDLHLLVAGEGHAVEGGHILALGAGGDDDDLVLGQVLDGTDVHQRPGGDLQVTQLHGDLQHVFHAPAGDGHLAAILVGHIDKVLQPVGVGGKGGDDDPLVAVLELPVKALCHLSLRGGVAGPLHIGGVAQQSQDALLAQLAQTAQIGDALRGGGVDLEVTGHHHGAHRGLDGEGHGVGDGVVHVDEFYLEAPGLDHLAGLMGEHLHLAGQVKFVQLPLHQADGQPRAVDGHFDILHQVGNAADMILVAVGQEKTPQFVLVLYQIGGVGNDRVNAVHIVFREAHTAVYHDHVPAILQNGDIFADFVQAAQRDDFQFFAQIISLRYFKIDMNMAGGRHTKRAARVKWQQKQQPTRAPSPTPSRRTQKCPGAAQICVWPRAAGTAYAWGKVQFQWTL